MKFDLANLIYKPAFSFFVLIDKHAINLLNIIELISEK
ncbi:hypothetical protein NC99_09480 [Sunxiuqinia dokdonensis]|uniref:Uncharacterized protein n=1 Tax=Sunxiuqinia dokdonensis TaxID=1409788 RepID=A0A0L8VCQ2_9BACT|nr:hypothetical protein NC99_09480 [Sunxiuqinia dokdonensis]